MKHFFNRKALILIIVSTIVCIAVAIVAIVIISSADYGIKELTVNGVSANISGREINVSIQQTDNINIAIVMEDKDVEIKMYTDAKETHQVNNLSNIKTNGKDTIFYLTTGKNGDVKERYKLYIVNIIDEDNYKLSFKINGNDITATASTINVTLPFGDRFIDLSDIVISPYFSLNLYEDYSKQTLISNYSGFTLRDNQENIYIDVCNNKLGEVFLSYIVHFDFIKSTSNELISLKMNDTLAELNDSTAQISVARSNKYIIVPEISNKATIDIYYDAAKENKIDTLSSFELDNSASNNELYITVTAENGNMRDYVLNILFIKESANDIIALSANDYDAVIEQDSAEIVLPRASIFNLQITVSNFASYSVYYDSDKTKAVKDLTYINELNTRDKVCYLYIFISAENGNEKLYTITLKFILNNDVSIDALYVNDVNAHISNNTAAAMIERSNSLSITTTCTALTSLAEYYYDEACSSKIINNNNIDISEFAGKRYKIFIKITAENDNYLIYPLTVTFIPSQEALLLDMQVNNKSVIFNDHAASLEFEGTTDTFELNIQHLDISRFASFGVYSDDICLSEYSDINSISLVSSEQTIYIRVVAENADISSIYCLNLRLISNDNEIKSITLNGQETIIKSESCEIIIESTSIICLDNISLDENATVSIYYDLAQTQPVENLNDISFAEHQTELYFRVIAENNDIKVYHVIVKVKYAPEIIFPVNSVQLSERQTLIPIEDLFTIIGNSYSQNQFNIETCWDGTAQNTDYISIENSEKYYALQVKVSSRYFQSIIAEKSIKVIPYVLTPISASILQDNIEIKDMSYSFSLDEIINLDEGSYRLGTDYYVELYSKNSTKIVVDKNSSFLLDIGTVDVFVNSFKDEFEAIYVGKIQVRLLEKIKPTIIAQTYLECPVSNNSIIIRDLFEIVNNDYEISLIKTFVNGSEASSMLCDTAGTFILKLQVIFSDGVMESEIELCVTNISDNTNISVMVNDNLVQFTDNTANLDPIPFNGDFNILVEKQSTKTSISILLNGIEANMNNLQLIDGQNEITIIAVAESGDESTYKIYVTKEVRKLPVIQAENTTIQLVKFQTSIDLSPYFKITQNDYTGVYSIYCNDEKLLNPVLSIPNKDAVYKITVKYEGEFGSIEKTFSVGVIQYNEVEIIFARSVINQPSPSYVFSLIDFVTSINYYGIDKDSCVLKLYSNNELFTSGTLRAGSYLIAIQVWYSNALIKEETNWFTIINSESEKLISVNLKSSEIVLRSSVEYPNIEDVFNIDYADYEKDSLRFSYIYEQLEQAQNRLVLNPGNNRFTLLINNIITGEELYKGIFNILCEYIPYSSTVFKQISINSLDAQIDKNTINLINNSPLENISIDYIANESFTVTQIQNEISIQSGVNIIEYTATENGYEFIGIIILYNICHFEKYINALYYNNTLAEKNKIILSTGEIFDASKITLDFEDSHISTEFSVNSSRNDAYEVVIYGYYDDIAIGYTYLQVYIGHETPRLLDIISTISADGLIDYTINEYNCTLYLLSDENNISINIKYQNNIYTSNITLNDLQIGQSLKTISIIKEDIFHFEYEMELWVFPTLFVQKVFYDDIELQNTNNIYLCEDTNFDKGKVKIDLNILLTEIPFTTNWITTEYNGEIVGGTYLFSLNYIDIFYIEVALTNSNVTVELTGFTANLTQNGDSVFVDTIEIDKNETQSSFVYFCIINAIYPYTTIEGADLKKVDYLGYTLTLDLSDFLQNDAGTYETIYHFTAKALDGEKDYSLRLTINILEQSSETTFDYV